MNFASPKLTVCYDYSLNCHLPLTDFASNSIQQPPYPTRSDPIRRTQIFGFSNASLIMSMPAVQTSLSVVFSTSDSKTTLLLLFHVFTFSISSAPQFHAPSFPPPFLIHCFSHGHYLGFCA